MPANKQKLFNHSAIIAKIDHYLIDGVIRVNPEHRHRPTLTIKAFRELLVTGYVMVDGERKIVLTDRGKRFVLEWSNRKHLLMVARGGWRFVDFQLSPMIDWPDFLKLRRRGYIKINNLGNVVLTPKGRKAAGLKSLTEDKPFYRTAWIPADEIKGFELYCARHGIPLKPKI